MSDILCTNRARIMIHRTPVDKRCVKFKPHCHLLVQFSDLLSNYTTNCTCDSLEHVYIFNSLHFLICICLNCLLMYTALHF
jgi:hypothetical protein